MPLALYRWQWHPRRWCVMCCLAAAMPLLQAEAVELKLQEESVHKVALQKEVLQLKLISAESEQANQALRDQLAEAKKALGREQAEHQATSAALSDLRSDLVSREQQLAEARQLLDSMSAELGILSSRYHRLQQERDTLRTARRQQQSSWQQQQQQQGGSCDASASEPLTGAAAAAAQLQSRLLSTGSIASSGMAVPEALGSSATTHRTGLGLDPSDSQPGIKLLSRSQWELQQMQQGLPLDVPISQAVTTSAAGSNDSSSRTVAPESGSSAPRDSSPCELQEVGVSVQSVLNPVRDNPVPRCAHHQLEAACLLCICQRFLAATAGSCSHLAAGSCSVGPGSIRPGGITTAGSSAVLPSDAADRSSSTATPSAAGLATAAVAACANEAAQYRQFLSISELARNRLEAENATLQQQMPDLQKQVEQQQQQLWVLQAHPAALSACSIEELSTLEGEAGLMQRGWLGHQRMQCKARLKMGKA